MENPFQSFWMGGFECCDMLNRYGQRVDLIRTTGHLDLVEEDYTNVQRLGIHTVREGIRWSQVEKAPFEYDWADVIRMLLAGKRLGMQQVWDICHFGFPDDLSPLHPKFTPRFVSLCLEFVNVYRRVHPQTVLIMTPVNEVSFLSWLGGDNGSTVPFCHHEGWALKYALMEAYIAAIQAVRKADANVVILTTEPLVNIVPSTDATDTDFIQAKSQNDAQFQVLDILTGRLCPELGGSPDCVDVIGLNYYYNNQWIMDTFEYLPWNNDFNDPRWRPLNHLLKDVYERYRYPIILSETSHPKEHRPNWLDFVARECSCVVQNGLPLWGVCWYPVVDRPDWDDLNVWHRAGLWDVTFENGIARRQLHQPTAEMWMKTTRHVPDLRSAV